MLETYTNFSTSLLVAVTGALLYIIVKVYNGRKVAYHLRQLGLPMPPLSPFIGHVLSLNAVKQKLPPDAAIVYSVTELAFKIKAEAFYLDLWPFTNPLLVVTTPNMASQLAQSTNLLKPCAYVDGVHGVTGGPNLLTMPDEPWKRWRSIFNPGFSQNSILQQTPKIVGECRIFCERMSSRAREGRMFCLEDDTMQLTLDVISVITLDTHFSNATVPDTLRELVDWTTFRTEFNPFNRYNPVRPFKLWYNGRKINSYVEAELEKRFLERRSSGSLGSKPKSAKSIVSLALDAYMEEAKQLDASASEDTLDETFKRYACAQIRLFLFAGHDTTSGTMIYIYHLLAANPECLARLREEHDRVFGPATDANGVGDLLSDNPALLNQLPYTTACIKETLRLYPPVSGMRQGSPSTVLVDSNGTCYPTEGCDVWNLHLAIHRNPETWPLAHRFIPDRWLVAPDDPLHPPKGAWRPFEFGSRNCIGQTLAWAELRIVLAMSIRRFDIRPAYDEWDRLHPTSSIKTAFGERAYQAEGGGGGAHAANGYPCRVRFAEGMREA